MTSNVCNERTLTGSNSVVTVVGVSADGQGGISAVVRSLASGGLADLYTLDYVKTHVDGRAREKLLVAAVAGLRLAARQLSHGAGLLHVHVASRASFWRKCLLLLPAHVLGRKVLLHLHGAEFKIFYERECSNIGRRIIRYAFESASAVVVLSDSWRQWIERLVPQARVRVIYNPAPTVRLGPASRRKQSTLLFLGRLGDRKGTSDLLKAVAKVLKEGDQVRVILGGDGDIPAMKRLAQELGILQFVEFLGWVDGPRKSELLHQCSVFVLPSYNEGLPMGLLEAMGHGMPVVTTPVGGIPEAVTDGVEGFLIQPGDVDALADRLSRLMRDPELRETMGSAGARKVAEVFAVDRIIPQWVALYSELGVMPCRGVCDKVR